GPTDGEEVEQNPQDQAGIVEPEGPQPELLAEGRPLGVDVAQTKIDEPDRKLAECAEQRRMSMVQREKGAVLVVVDEWRVERATAKHAGTDEVPERRADDVGIGQAVLEPLVCLDQAVVTDRL